MQFTGLASFFERVSSVFKGEGVFKESDRAEIPSMLCGLKNADTRSLSKKMLNCADSL